MKKVTQNNVRQVRNGVALVVTTFALIGCSTTGGIQNGSGSATRTITTSVPGPVAGVGIEGHDIVRMTDEIMRDMRTNPRLLNRSNPPRVIVDSAYFRNDSLQALNTNTITDRLRVNLNRAARGDMIFVGRHYRAMMEEEAQLADDLGGNASNHSMAHGDYRLGGRITSQDSRSASTGMIQRYNQIIFEMVDLKSNVIVWSGMYDVTRAGADDVVYR